MTDHPSRFLLRAIPPRQDPLAEPATRRAVARLHGLVLLLLILQLLTAVGVCLAFFAAIAALGR